MKKSPEKKIKVKTFKLGRSVVVVLPKALKVKEGEVFYAVKSGNSLELKKPRATKYSEQEQIDRYISYVRESAGTLKGKIPRDWTPEKLKQMYEEEVYGKF